ncbi:anti-repressor SinI family protein [Alkalihalobacillus sp. CinArs1]|uniref:anti-repressor SinI family protein n=1 Tax=Alkalihalobacillus sp. CinArs1 TaxID=2995314 RepID=UPI0022DD0C6F|nr:anti-repressor SinI family protein [Alkalihalobacillus sp. CinArs1]
MIKTRPEQALDQEWVMLMKVAREIGLKKDEIRAFLDRKKDPTPVRIQKRRAID